MMIVTSVYGVVDGLFVSNIVGANAFAAVNFIMPFVMIFGSVGFMIGTGGSAIVAKLLGEQRERKANEVFSMLITVLIISGIVLALLGVIFIHPVARFLGATDDLMGDCVLYGSILLCGLPGFMLQNSFQSFFVVAERPKLGFGVSVIAGVTNMALDFLFMYVFRWGVAGAAAATIISQYVGGAIPLVFFLRKNETPLSLVNPVFDKRFLFKACTNGSSEMMTNLSVPLVNMLYNSQLLALYGENGVSAYGIIMYVSFIFQGIYMGFSVGSAPLISYNYGAANHGELSNLFKKGIAFMIGAALILTAAAELSAGFLSGIFVGYDEELHELSAMAMRFYSLAFIISGMNIFGSAFFTALNNGLISALISFLRTLVFETSMIMLLPMILGDTGIWLAITAAELLALIFTVTFFVKYKKKYHY